MRIIRILSVCLLLVIFSTNCSRQNKEELEKQKEELLKDDRQIIILHNNANDTIYAWLNMLDMDLSIESPDGSPGLIIAPHDSISGFIHLNYFDLAEYFEVWVIRKSVRDTLPMQVCDRDTSFIYSLEDLRKNSFVIFVRDEDLTGLAGTNDQHPIGACA